MKFSTITKSLRFRVFAISAGGILVLSIISTLTFGYFFISETEKHLTNKASSIAKLLASNVETPMDFEALLGETGISEDGTKILNTAKTDKDFKYAIVYRPKDKTTKKITVFAKAGDVPASTRKKMAQVKENTTFQSDNLVHSVQFIKKDNKHLGTLFLGFSKNQLEQGTQKIIKWGSIAAAILSGLFITVFFWLISSTAVKPILRITQYVKRIGEGDLRPFGKQGIGTQTTELVDMYTALEAATTAFRNNVEAITDSAGALLTTSDHILGSSTDLSLAANEQATAVSETTVTIEEVEKTGHMTAKNAKNIQTIADHTQQISKEGLGAVDDTRSQLEDIQKQVENIVRSSKKLNEELEEVDRIIASVASVTQQSHTLSINASIEAAKAGAAGRGFAVVANKIRDLSQQSREATEQVRRTLVGVQTAIGNIVVTNEKGLVSAKRGVASIERTGEVIRRLSESISKSTEAARSIAENTLQQATGLEQTAKAMNEINDATRKNLLGIEAVKNSGEELKDQAVSMEAAVDLFTIK